MSGLSNNIDFLVHTVRHPGFAEKQATTAFFDENLSEIMSKLSPAPGSGVSIHSVFGLIAHIFAARTPVTAQPSKTQFKPWDSAVCGDWRSFGTVTNAINIVGPDSSSVSVGVASKGDSFTFSLPSGESTPVTAVVKSIRKVDAGSTHPSASESVWELSVEVDGHRRSGTVSCYRSGSLTAASTVIDGTLQQICLFIFLLIVDM